MENEKKNDFVNIYGIKENCVHEQHKKADGSLFYNVSLRVPKDISDNGYASVAVNPKFVHKSTKEEGTYNIGFGKDWNVNLSVSKNGEFQNVEMKPWDILQAVNKAKEAGKTEAEPVEAEAENDEPEIG